MSGPPSSQPGFRMSPPPQQQQQQPHHHEQQDRCYDPRHDAQESRDYEPECHDSRSYPVSPEGMRRNPPPYVVAISSRVTPKALALLRLAVIVHPVPSSRHLRVPLLDLHRE